MRIARDMHDTVSQSLFGLSLAIDGAQSLVRTDPERAEAELAALKALTETIRSDLRELIFDLWPNELTAERFSADLNRYFAELSDQPPLLDLDIRGEFAVLSPYERRTLYRICQESLANVVHHAKASNARVCLDVEHGRARLLVRDDGVGFVPAAVEPTNDRVTHFGLRSIEERTQTLGGTFDLFSRPHEGTSIVVDVPVNSLP